MNNLVYIADRRLIISGVPIRKYIDTQLFCPLTGAKLKGHIIPPHKMYMMQCENGSLFAKCPHHVVRCFISDFTTVKMIMDASKITKIVDTNKKETKHVAS